ncbi:MAG TPA: ferritin-like domain-containing protein [Woeseiaceae bacterium]|nr:ferritin-like domain-containing protein [Woeseiaceae bacterium]
MTEQNPGWARWKTFFAARQHRPGARLLADDKALAAVPASVARSLAIFQLGESGGGSVIDQARRSRLPSLDADYADAIALFVAEEHRHAELLACCVRALRGRLIEKNWTARLFVFGRRLIGLRLKILVLLAAEVVGICYYQLLAASLPDSELKAVLREIAVDEKAHLAFHCDFLRSQVRTNVQRRLFIIAWRALMLAAALVVAIDHRAALRDLAIPPGRVWRRWSACSRMAEARVAGCKGRPEPLYAH